MSPKWILIGIALACASAAHAVDGAPQQDETIRLVCTGTMIAGGQDAPESRIAADGNVDFVKRRVSGFGIGTAPIVFTSAREVRFGSSPLKVPDGGQTIEGSIDRTTGKTRVVVRSSRDPSQTLIAMNLDCRLTPPVS